MTDQEINEAVARKLGWVVSDGMLQSKVPGHFCGGSFMKIPDYCGKIEAAFEIAEKHRMIGYHGFELKAYTNHWYACWADADDTLAYADADTAPRAICLAFLKLEK